uniref:Uncharacterized protein n=1 Tax=Romanomermis culicivorax TaxID=13658 RepID=A0A915KES5_ROMCU
MAGSQGTSLVTTRASLYSRIVPSKVSDKIVIGNQTVLDVESPGNENRGGFGGGVATSVHAANRTAENLSNNLHESSKFFELPAIITAVVTFETLAIAVHLDFGQTPILGSIAKQIFRSAMRVSIGAGQSFTVIVQIVRIGVGQSVDDAHGERAHLLVALANGAARLPAGRIVVFALPAILPRLAKMLPKKICKLDDPHVLGVDPVKSLEQFLTFPVGQLANFFPGHFLNFTVQNFVHGLPMYLTSSSSVVCRILESILKMDHG